MGRLKVPLLAGIVAVLAFAAVGCGGSGGGDENTLVFGTASDPTVLDGALISDGESIRVIYQMTEGLTALEPGTSEVIPSLATDWTTSDDGLAWTFNLREDVTFHDGEPFNAEAVCFNFDRWFNFPARSRARGRRTTGSSASGAASRTRTSNARPRRQPVRELRGGRRVDRDAHPHQAVVDDPRDADAARASHREPEGARGVRGGRGSTERRRRLPAERDVRHRAPDRHRPVQVRLLDRRRPARRSSATTTTGASRRRSERSSSGRSPTTPLASRRLQTGEIQGYDLVEPQDVETDRGRRQPAAARPSAVQRRLRHDQPGEAADGQARGAAGSRARAQPRRAS